MPTTSYTLSIHPDCIEGVQLSKRNERFSIKEEHSYAFIPTENGVSVQEKIEYFLAAHQWKNHPVSFLVPTEEVSFRTLHFPFQDKKKIQQAIPFEIESEVLEETNENSYQYTLQMLPNGTTNVLLLFIRPSYLQTLIALANQHNLLIKNIDCVAHALFKSVPLAEERKIQFQIYFGVEETFINVIEDQRLQVAKAFPNRIAPYLHQYPDLFRMKPVDLSQILLAGEAVAGKAEPSLQEGISLIREEMQSLCLQFNLFLKTWQIKGPIEASFHGMFGPLVVWNGQSFQIALQNPRQTAGNDAQMVALPVAGAAQASWKSDTLIDSEEIGLEQEPEEEDSAEVPQKTDTEVTWNIPDQSSVASQFPSKAPEIVTHLSSFAPHWGILGELKKYGLRHLEGHDLSFYSEGTPFIRFLRTYRIRLAVSCLFLILAMGSLGGNYFLKLQLLEKEIEVVESQLQTRLKRLAPESINAGVSTAIASLQNKVVQKREAQKEKRFEQRTYSHLSFLKRLSQLLPDAHAFNMKRVELSASQFRVTGNADSYENLEIFKKNLAAFAEFKDKAVVPDYRKTKDQIFYTIIVNRQP